MKTNLISAILLLAILSFIQCAPQEKTEPSINDLQPTSEETNIAHGEYLVNVMGCDHCHSPKLMTDKGPAPDPSRHLMGYPADMPLPEIDPTEVVPGKWTLFHGDLTAAVGPWGVSYAANLTPHDTGVGLWSYENFKASMTQGKHKGLENGRMVLPPMPWQSYASMKDSDLEAIWAYLQTVTPIENIVPAPQPPFGG